MRRRKFRQSSQLLVNAFLKNIAKFFIEEDLLKIFVKVVNVLELIDVELLLLLLLHLVFSHRLREHDKADSVKVKCGLS